MKTNRVSGIHQDRVKGNATNKVPQAQRGPQCKALGHPVFYVPGSTETEVLRFGQNRRAQQKEGRSTSDIKQREGWPAGLWNTGVPAKVVGRSVRWARCDPKPYDHIYIYTALLLGVSPDLSSLLDYIHIIVSTSMYISTFFPWFNHLFQSVLERPPILFTLQVTKKTIWKTRGFPRKMMEKC